MRNLILGNLLRKINFMSSCVISTFFFFFFNLLEYNKENLFPRFLQVCNYLCKLISKELKYHKSNICESCPNNFLHVFYMSHFFFLFNLSFGNFFSSCLLFVFCLVWPTTWSNILIFCFENRSLVRNNNLYACEQFFSKYSDRN